MRKPALIIFGLIFIAIIPLHAQEEIAVKEVIASLFEGMKSRDAETLRNAFHPEATMQTVISNDAGAELGSNTVSDFVNRIVSTPEGTILDERILDFQIKVDGQMAAAWTPYEFYVNDKFSHCGVNSFQLIKTVDGWKITYIIDTRRKDCVDS
ncbi:nuclear transport factor 2 family protein [Aquiflexum sp.]|uniref:nuclear transport factor 2 family protein n=1 Tax=Aquiflexum sp. TaxID=1872584 RepID=UPI003594930E